MSDLVDELGPPSPEPGPIYLLQTGHRDADQARKKRLGYASVETLGATIVIGLTEGGWLYVDKVG